MDIKEFIGHFPEIADRERHEQFTLLEKSKAHTFTPATARMFQWYSWFLPVFVILGFGGVLYSLFGYAGWLPFAAIVLGLIISRQMINRRREALIKMGLDAVLRAEGKRETTE